MTRPLTVRNAQITTAAVEIKTLTISGKQVTLAVFRQIKVEPLLARDGSLRGELWGTVNYHPGKCAGNEPHWHVVWQKGSELRRSYVSYQIPWDAGVDQQQHEASRALIRGLPQLFIAV